MSVATISNLRFMDVILMTFFHCFTVRSDHADKLKEYLSSKHLNIYFSVEKGTASTLNT